MFGKATGRIGLIFMLFIGIAGVSFIISVFVIGQQQDDGLIVNLAGRQRMLTQKMSKELLIYAQMPEGAERMRQREQVLATTRVFATTLTALTEGGTAPTDLAMTTHRDCPPAGTAEIGDQLRIVAGLWGPIETNIRSVLDSNGTNGAALTFVIGNNVELLTEMNSAVSMMQADSESKVATLFVVQGASVFVGIILAFFGILIIRSSLTKPLNELAQAAQTLSTGNLEQEVQVRGVAEVDTLSDAFERLRLSMASMLASQQQSEAGMDDEFDDL